MTEMRAKRAKGSRWLRRLLALAVAAVLVLPVVGVWLAVDSAPVVQKTKPLEAADAYRVKRIARRSFQRIANTTGRSQLAFSESELNGLAALGARALPGFRGRVNITRWGLESAASVPVPGDLIEGYVNLHAGLEPSSRGIRFSHLSIGAIRIPGGAAIAALRLFGDLALGERRGSLIIDTVEGVDLEHQRIVLRVNPSPRLRTVLKDARSRLKSIRDRMGLLGDRNAIGVYYGRIEALDARLDDTARGALASYVGPLFALARERSRQGDPVVENEALIYALATYFGSYRFGTLTGMERVVQSAAAPGRKGNPALAGRHDLRLHFLISAGLELLSNHDVTIAIGEFKELLDTEQGGSGFSFTDLAADRAGVRFARVATAGFGSARRLQEALADRRSEAAFFPSLDGLRDGLSRSDFKRIYGGVEGQRYRATVAEIDARIAALPAYRR